MNFKIIFAILTYFFFPRLWLQTFGSVSYAAMLLSFLLTLIPLVLLEAEPESPMSDWEKMQAYMTQMEQRLSTLEAKYENELEQVLLRISRPEETIGTYEIESEKFDHRDLKKKTRKYVFVTKDTTQDVTELESRVAELETKWTVFQLMQNNLKCVSDQSDANDLYFKGCNVHIENGEGATFILNGRGNLIVGYNKDANCGPLHGGNCPRTGSHNIVSGSDHAYTSYSGFISGYSN